MLHTLPKTTTSSKKRVGRGTGSGKGGHTAGRGMKGQRSRSGGKRPLWFEGGQLPLVKRLPMLKGKGRFNVVRPVAEITLTDLENLPEKNVSLETLILHEVIDRRFKKAKIINTGSLSKKVTVKGIKTTAAARKAIEKAGGQVE